MKCSLKAIQRRVRESEIESDANFESRSIRKDARNVKVLQATLEEHCHFKMTDEESKHGLTKRFEETARASNTFAAQPSSR
jgi:hypothetical protein